MCTMEMQLVMNEKGWCRLDKRTSDRAGAGDLGSGPTSASGGGGLMDELSKSLSKRGLALEALRAPPVLAFLILYFISLLRAREDKAFHKQSGLPSVLVPLTLAPDGAG